MLREIRMPNLGTTNDEVKIIRWFKREGEEVKRGEPLLEVETDKAAMEVESFAAGYLKKIVAHPDDEVASGEIIAYIGDHEDIYNISDKAKPESSSSIAKRREVTPPTTSGKDMRVSPMVRKLAESMGIDLAGIRGTGPNGLILREDILKAHGTAPEIGKANLPVEEGETIPVPPPDGIAPFTRVGKAIAGTMTKSKATIPHVYFRIDAEASAMMALRSASEREISYNAMLLHTVADTLKDFPYLACRYNEEGRILAKQINIGFAASKGDDLFVPVVKNIGREGLDIRGVEAEIQRLTDAVRNGALKQEDLSGGVFTVTNLGTYGLSSFTAVINPPEVAILAVGAIQDRVVAVNGGIHIHPMLTMTLSVDHRVVNGVYAASFMKALKDKIETLKG
ncbi:MAG: dihydrolipoamide acetyltransferase family protein [Clostridia bacterium]|jgi:pyruvate dehydrogenase E2 component (dihydrolipoamide acetyltransferase)